MTDAARSRSRVRLPGRAAAVATAPPEVARRASQRRDAAAASRPGARDRDARSARAPRGPQRERHEPDYLILLTIVALAAVGLLMVYSTSGVMAYLAYDDTLALLAPQLVWAVLGVVAMLVLMRTDYRYLRLASVPAYLVTVVLLILVFVPGLGREVGGASRWLQIGGLPAVHPAEFAKLALVVYLAHWMARRGTAISSVLHGTIPFLLIAGPIIGLVFVEPDLGTTGVLVLTAFTMFFVAGANLWQFALLIPAGMAAVAVAVTSRGYQSERVQTFLDPFAVKMEEGYQTVQGLLALAVGGVFGTGLGTSGQPGALDLPNAQNDFVFAVVGHELGLVGGVVVIALFLLVAYRGVRVALSAPDTFGALLAAGITAWLGFQAFINLAVVVQLVPITGIPLPFVSDGGSSLIVSFAAVGILLSISRETLPRGTWNDADPHRGRGYGRPHLPGARRPPLPARAGR